MQISHHLLALLLSFLVLSACQQRSEMVVDPQKVIIEPKPLSVTKIQIQNWKVGPNKDQEISRGVLISLDVPQFSTSDLKEIVNERAVDSWYIQMRRGGEVLQRTAAPFHSSGKQIRAITLNMQYAASALSMRFAQSPCPAFQHKKTIEKVELMKLPKGNHQITLSPLNESKMNASFEFFEMRPNSINGGHQLQGEYRFEIALFDSKTRTLRSNFMSYPEAAVVGFEKDTPIKGCEGFSMPDQNSGNNVEEFKFGR